MVRAFKRAMERLVFGMTAEEEDGLSSSLPSKDDPSSNLNHEHSATVVSFKYMPDKKEKRLWDKWRNMASGGASGLACAGTPSHSTGQLYWPHGCQPGGNRRRGGGLRHPC